MSLGNRKKNIMTRNIVNEDYNLGWHSKRYLTEASFNEEKMFGINCFQDLLYSNSSGEHVRLENIERSLI